MIAFVLASALFTAPQLPSLPPIRRDPQVTYVDRAGAVIGVRGGRYGPPVNLSQLPAYVPAAFVAIEDRRFYEHSGFDAVGIARAVVKDLTQGRASQGASTITQQLARNLFLSSDRTVQRKATELVYAVELEQTYSKQQILGLYLSRIYFGSGAYGIEDAAQRYFNKPAARLTLMEAAMLASIPKSPVNYDPADQPEASKARAALVLDAMVETGAITSAQRAQALAHPPKVWKTAANAPAQYFVDWLDGQTHALVGAPKQDVVVETTLDMTLESAAASSAKAVIAHGASARLGQAALVSLDGYGRLRAMVGGADYGASPYNRAIAARRQAGSSWKPFVYLTALETGLTPDSPVVDEPVTIDGWSPHNFEDGYLGPITLQTALAQSINTVAARLADQVGRPNVAATAKRLGITAQVNTDPAMALGTTLVTPLEMAQAYSTFADAGYRNPIYAIERIRTDGGQVLWQHRASPPAQVIANPPLSELNQMLRQVVATGTGAHAAIPGYDVAGKTGTTSDFKDAWFCGFTGNLITVVWMGRDDNSPMRGVTGGSAPAAFWHDYMRVAVKHEQVWAIPAGPQPPAPLVPPPGTAPSIAPFPPPPIGQPLAPQPQQPPAPGDDGGPLG